MGAGRVRVGGWLSLSDPLVTEAAGRAGFDWVGIDLQHGAWDLGSAARGIQLLDLLDVPVLVRVMDEELQMIPHVLDHGASGIVLAMCDSPDTATAAVARARYQPEGLRSYGGQRYGMRAEPTDVTTLRPAIYPMIETRQGLERISDIASVPGIAGIHVGPVDLGLSLGLGHDRGAPAFSGALRRIVAATHAAGLPAAMHAVTTEQVPEIIALGFDELVLTADIALLRGAFETAIKGARERAR